MKSFFSVVFVFIAMALYGQNRVITTGVPFLLITSDARSAGMGEQGVATTPDAFSKIGIHPNIVLHLVNQELA